MPKRKRPRVKNSAFNTLLHHNVGELGLFIVLIFVLLIAAVLISSTQSAKTVMLAAAPPSKENQPRVLSEESSPLPQRCAVYTRGEKQLTHCATCGNGVCEPFEECVATTIYTNGKATTDCGKLYCLSDCSKTASPSPYQYQ